jgi:hypothetical protein
MAQSDPNSEPVKAAVRRWDALLGGVVRTDDPMRPKLGKAADALMTNPLFVRALRFDVRVLSFLKTVKDGMRERGELQ